MAVQLTDRGAIRRQYGPGGWTVTLVECPDGLANVSTSHGVTRVFVADLPVAGSTETSAYAAAACTPDGDALVLSRQAPPALLVAAHGLRRAPEVPGSDEWLNLGPDEALLLLSSAVFEEMPHVLAHVLHGHPDELLGADPGTFLTDIFEQTGSGAGAMISRRAAPTESEGAPA